MPQDPSQQQASPEIRSFQPEYRRPARVLPTFLSQTLGYPVSPEDLADLQLEIPQLQALDRELCDELATIRFMEAEHKAKSRSQRNASTGQTERSRLRKRRQILNQLREGVAVQLKVLRLERHEAVQRQQLELQRERHSLFVAVARERLSDEQWAACWLEVDRRLKATPAVIG